MTSRLLLSALLGLITLPVVAQQQANDSRFSKDVQQYIKYDSPRIVLTHIRVIDGRGSAAQEDRNVIIENGKITAIDAGADVPPGNGTVVDMHGRTLLPGIVGMHNHLYYIARPNLDASGKSEPPLLVPQMTFSAPRLYLAAGVTTARTTGSVEGYADINLRHLIDSGQELGPHLDVTAPYLQGKSDLFMQMYQLKDAEDARRFVNYWADAGATSFKAYMHITRAELKAAVEAAHQRGLKVTGHLCAVTYPEAIEAGIDDLEHGFYVNTQSAADKQPDVCPIRESEAFLEHNDANSPEAKALMRRWLRITLRLPRRCPSLSMTCPTGRH